jgi:hypothetical protein
VSVSQPASVAAEPSAAQPSESSTMARPVGPPDSTFHMKLGYAVAGAIFAAYIALLLKRVASVRRSR